MIPSPPRTHRAGAVAQPHRNILVKRGFPKALTSHFESMVLSTLVTPLRSVSSPSSHRWNQVGNSNGAEPGGSKAWGGGWGWGAELPQRSQEVWTPSGVY